MPTTGRALTAPDAELLIQPFQFNRVAQVLPSVQQPGDPFRVQVQRRRLLPQPPAPLRAAALLLDLGQLPDQKKHELLFLAGQLAAVVGSHQCHPSPRAYRNQFSAKSPPPLCQAFLTRRHAPLNHADGPFQLPPCGHPDRLMVLQGWRRTTGWLPAGWVAAIEDGSVAVDVDLLAVLAERLDGPSALRLLRWWWQQPGPDPRWPALMGGVRDPQLAAWLRDRLACPDRPGAPETIACLLPLLGFQRQPQDGAVLARWALAPQPGAVRRAALEGLAVGLSSWPQAALRRCLRSLAGDLDSALAAVAVDLLARLPRARADLMALGGVTLEAAVEQRRQRRLAALPVSPLLLVVHGRAGGVVPVEVQEIRAELARRRQAPVLVQALTGDAPQPPAAVGGPGASMLTLVPLMLLPGGHVRHDIPTLAARWQQLGPLRRLPFLGAWPTWQRALAEEFADLAGPGTPIGEPPVSAPSPPPLMLHHPVEGRLGQRYLATLERRTGARCLATPYSADHLAELQLTLTAPALPLALAANRLTDALAPLVGPPLLQRPRFRQLLLAELEALP